MTPANTVLAAVMTALNVTMKELASPRRHKHLAEARVTAAYLLQTESNMGREAVAKLFRRSPGWASWSLYHCPDMAAVDKHYAGRVNAVRTAMKGVAA